MAEFADNVDRVNRLAEKIEGFVWRLQDDSGHAMNMRVYDDPTILPNLTLWSERGRRWNASSGRRVHGRFYRRRETWFAPMDTPLVMWWVEAGERPTMAEGVQPPRSPDRRGAERTGLRLGKPAGREPCGRRSAAGRTATARHTRRKPISEGR